MHLFYLVHIRVLVKERDNRRLHRKYDRMCLGDLHTMNFYVFDEYQLLQSSDLSSIHRFCTGVMASSFRRKI